MGSQAWFDRIMVLLGLWVAMSPLFLSYPGGLLGAAALNAYLVGLAVAALSVFVVVRGGLWPDWGNLLLALWLIAAPWLLGYTENGFASWIHTIAGVLIGTNALFAILLKTRHGPVRY